MAKDPGSVEAPNCFLYAHASTKGAETNTPYYMYYIFRGQIQHEDWETDNQLNTLMATDVTRVLAIASSAVFKEYWWVGEPVKNAFATNPASNTTSGWKTDAQVQIPQGTKMRNRKEVKYIVCKQKFFDSSLAGDVKILSVAFESKNDTAYSGTGAELLTRSSNRLFNPDYPCSAWHVMKCLAETHEKILYENRPAMAVVMFGNGTT